MTYTHSRAPWPRRLTSILIPVGGAALLVAAKAFTLDGLTGASATPGDQRPNDVVIAWNQNAVDALVAHDKYADPLNAVRTIALVHIAQHDAVNAAVPAFEQYAFQGRDAEADPVAAAASAARDVLVAEFPAQQAALDAKLAQSLASVPDGEAETRGVQLGKQAAAALLALRAEDGSDAPIVGSYVPGSGPGKYQFTAPWTFAYLPGWVSMKPFALASASQFRSAPPPPLNSAKYAADFAEVKAKGRKNSTARSADETAYAHFWYEFSDIGWNSVGRAVAVERRLGLMTTARLFAQLNMAMSDSYVAGWDSKYHYDFWRPVTAIRAADTDGNPATAADATWETELMTPPVQDYPSTHSVLGRAAAEVLAATVGDRTSFTFASSSAQPPMSTRSFASFRQAADENARSRVMAGIHFRFAADAGQLMGQKIGQWTAAKTLRRR